MKFYVKLVTNHHIIVMKLGDCNIFSDIILGFWNNSRCCESILMKLLKLTILNVLILEIKSVSF